MPKNVNNETTGIRKRKNESPFNNFNLVVHTQQTPGNVLFENYEQLKTSIENGVSYYSQFEYGIENYDIAIDHHAELKFVKGVLEKAKREIVKGYNAPLETVKEKIDFLLDLIKVPFKKVDRFIRENDKKAKQFEIYTFARNIALYNNLGKHVDNIFKNPLFLESAWLNNSCSKRKWQMAVVSKIRKIAEDITYILSLNDNDKNNFLVLYYQTLSLEKVEEFRNSLNDISNVKDIDSQEDKTYQAFVCDDEIDHFQREVKLSDYEILNSVINFTNPYTGDTIFGIDNSLKERLIEIAQKVKLFNGTNDEQEKETVVITSGEEVINAVLNVYSEMAKSNYFGATMLVRVLRGCRNKEIYNYKFNYICGYGALKSLNSACVNEIVEYLVNEDFLRRTLGAYPTLRLNKNKGIDSITSENISAVEEIVNDNGKSSKNKIEVDGVSVTADEDGEILTDLELLKRLTELRNRISNENKIPCNRIIYDKALVYLATEKPLTEQEVLSRRTLRKKWFDRYGNLFLQEVINYVNNENKD